MNPWSPFEDYHPVVRDGGNSTDEVRSAIALAVIADSVGISTTGYFLVPPGSATGVAVGTPPAVCRGARVILNPGDAFQYVLAAAAPTAAPAAGTLVSLSNPSSNTTIMDWPEYFSYPLNMYVIGTLVGVPQVRFM